MQQHKDDPVGWLESQLLVDAEIKKQIEEVTKLTHFSADVSARQDELQQLQAMASKMGTELRLWKLESNADPRITVIESAHYSR
jgi:hypothetical protein